MIVTLSSVRGAPGVTSWSMLLAAAWPTEYVEGDDDEPVLMGRVVLEADLDGGVFGARYGIGVEPGAAAVVSTTRRGVSSIEIEDIGRNVAQRAWVVPGPESAEGARQLWAAHGVAQSVADSIAADSRIWFVDVGRAASRSPVAPMFSASALAVLMTRADHDSLVQVPARVADLRKVASDVGVIVVGKSQFPHDELAEFFTTPTVWTSPADDDVVALSRQAWTSKKIRRSYLWRSVSDVAHDLADRIVFQPSVEREQLNAG